MQIVFIIDCGVVAIIRRRGPVSFNPLLPMGAFQGTSNFHITLDVEGTKAHCHQHLFRIRNLHVEAKLCNEGV